MTNYREILRLDSLGLNKTQIADACDCSRTTVIAALRRAEEVGLCYPLPENLSDKELSMKLHPSAQSKPMYKIPDYEYVHKELQKSGVTLKLLWLEYCEKCRENGELPYQSTQFNKYYSDYAIKTNATMHLNHKPGEIMQVDWAGDTASVIDTVTGEIIPAYLFVASLPYSGYAYVEAFFSMNQECWIAAHVNAFKYFGGVTRILQCDNLKTGVISHGRTEVTLNKAYSEMAEHYGTAILPCRVRTPKDKAMVEGTVGVITNFVLGALRNRRFLSLPELNEAIWERLGILNNAPFQKREGSRATAFEDEKAFLLPLPPRPFELSEWKIATVAPNYHISIEKQNYSVPYEYIKQKVDVRITKSTIEVFFGGNRIASHPRLYGRLNQYSTVEAHMPPNHQQYIQWNGERFVMWAAKIGINNPIIGDMKLSDLNTRVMEKYYQNLLKVKSRVVNNRKPNNEYLTCHVVREIHKLLRCAFNQAVKWELMAKNPCINATLPKEEHKTRDIWDAPTLFKALELCDDDILKLAINLAFSCSLRMGEMLGLTWDCVEISDASIANGTAFVFVNKELQRVNRDALEKLNEKGIVFKFPALVARTNTALVLKEPKTKTSTRKVFLPKTVAEMLKVRYQEIQEYKELFGDEFYDYNLVFCNANGRPLEHQIITRSLQKLIRENDLPPVVFHSLRHSSITYKLKLNGGDIKSVQGDSGHAQVKMVTDVYSHILDEDRRLNAQRFEETFYQQKNPSAVSGATVEPTPVTPPVQEPQAITEESMLNYMVQNPEFLQKFKVLLGVGN